MDDFEHVEAQDDAKQNSPVVLKAAGIPETRMGLAAEACYWNDKKYSDGASVCDSRIRYKCWNGKWAEVGQC